MVVVDRNVVEDAVEQSSAVLYEEYSGRFMYGSTCFGIVGSLSDLVDFLIGIEDTDLRDSLKNSMKQDSMGLSTIFYFPRHTLESE